MINELAPNYGYKPEQIEIKIIGSKPGEKLYEELMTLEEITRSVELERYYAVKPAFTSLYHEIDYTYPGVVSSRVEKPYNSANEIPLTQEELKTFLYENQLLKGEAGMQFEPDQRYWGDKK